jgi:uncharacterized protein
MLSIHDPIHGTIEVSPAEIRLIDSWPFQRLRYIKQMGFSDLAFPGATHSRYAHSIGAMEMATRIGAKVIEALPVSAAARARLRQMVRLAVLFHDLGHPPLSHSSERVMPPVSALALDGWIDDPERRASHEDYTIKLLIDSELVDLVDEHFGDQGISSTHLAALVAGRSPPGERNAFSIDGVDVLPILSQVVSSEIDADRMDYLRRDAYYCGVSYGTFDHIWLTNNLTAVEYEGRWALALNHRGVWAFENFLLARLHMFLAVYYHHTAVCFDNLLARFYQSGEYVLPSGTEDYLRTDDPQLLMVLRTSQNPWAQKVVQRRAYRLLLETHDFDESKTHTDLDQRLAAAGIDFFRVRSQGILSKYFKKRCDTFPLLVVEPERGRVSRVEDYTPLYRRFVDVVALTRVYCRPDQLEQARQLIKPDDT